MESTTTSCSTATLAARNILQIFLRMIEIFTSTSAGKFYEQMLALIQSSSLELHQQYSTFETSQYSDSVFLFAGLSLNTVFQEQTPDKCTFYR